MRILVLHSELGVLRGGGENFTRTYLLLFIDEAITLGQPSWRIETADIPLRCLLGLNRFPSVAGGQAN